MADTVRITIPQGAWVLLATGPLDDCLIIAPHEIVYVYRATQPSPAWDYGYPIPAKTEVNLIPEAGQGIWAYCPDNDTTAYVTAG